jgi:AhpD family alkylhydroperoxidase
MLRAAVAHIRHIAPSQAGGRLAQVYREEMLAVTVSVASRCDYCADAHMIYLLASGMDGDKARDVRFRLGEADGLSDPEREAIRMAVRLTTDPRSIRPAHRQALTAAWPNLEERTELVTVICAFNSVCRLANSLGVDSEIPAPLRRFEAGKRGAIGLLARLASFSMNMEEKSLPGLPPEVDRAALRELFLHQIGFPAIPPGFELLELCPEIFDVQLRAIRTAAAVMPRERWIRIGLVVSRLTGCEYFSTNCGDWLRQRGENPADVIAAAEGSATTLADVENCCVRFARDLTLHSHTITEARIQELRRCGLSDGAILDLAFVTSVFNGIVRLVLALSPD